MKKYWDVVKLREVCRIDNKRNNGKDIPYVGMEDIESNTGTFLGSLEPRNVKSATFSFTSEHVLFGRLRPYLNKALLPDFDGHCSTEIFPIKVSECLDKNYLYYWITSDEIIQKINDTCTGARMPRANMKEVFDFEIPVPPLHKQQRIVSIVDEALPAITTAKENADRNRQNARILFENHLQYVFTQRAKEWVKKRLGDVCEYVNGKAHEQCIDENGRFIVVNSKFISSEGNIFKRSEQALLLLRPRDIAMVLSDVPNGKALAKCYLVEEADTFTLNQRICVLRSEQFHAKFLFYQLNRNRHFLSFDNGENQTNLRLNQVLSCPLFLPTIKEQESIAFELDALSAQTIELESIYQKKLANLDELKKSILQKAFSGELSGAN